MSGLSLEERDKTEKAEKEVARREAVKKLTKAVTVLADFVTGLKALKPDEIKDLDEKEMVTAMTNPVGNLGVFKTDAIINNLSSAHALKILDRGDKVTEEFLKALVNLKTATGATVTSMTELAQELKNRGNFTLAAQVGSKKGGNPAMRAHLESRGLRV
jgi:hypothetical protein